MLCKIHVYLSFTCCCCCCCYCCWWWWWWCYVSQLWSVVTQRSLTQQLSTWQYMTLQGV